MGRRGPVSGRAPRVGGTFPAGSDLPSPRRGHVSSGIPLVWSPPSSRRARPCTGVGVGASWVCRGPGSSRAGDVRGGLRTLPAFPTRTDESDTGDRPPLKGRRSCPQVDSCPPIGLGWSSRARAPAPPGRPPSAPPRRTPARCRDSGVAPALTAPAPRGCSPCGAGTARLRGTASPTPGPRAVAGGGAPVL